MQTNDFGISTLSYTGSKKSDLARLAAKVKKEDATAFLDALSAWVRANFKFVEKRSDEEMRGNTRDMVHLSSLLASEEDMLAILETFGPPSERAERIAMIETLTILKKMSADAQRKAGEDTTNVTKH